MNGVVNFISKTPRELNGNSATITFGGFSRDIEGGQQLGRGTLWGINATHARAVNDRWCFTGLSDRVLAFGVALRLDNSDGGLAAMDLLIAARGSSF